MALSIYLYAPNLIGYARVLTNVWAFSICFKDKDLFVALYFFSFFLDYMDGRFAVWFNQKSTFGAVLDMVIDRMSTAALLMLLTILHPDWFLLAAGLLTLDISSHWLQMYSSFLGSKVSHKETRDTDFWLMRAYYGCRPFMAYCCIGAEVLYLAAYLLHEDDSGSSSISSTFTVEVPSVGRVPLMQAVAAVALPGWVLKQVINTVQMGLAADVCVQYDVQRRPKTA
eukprot:jgi/Mesen1/9248/ME000006S09246